MKTMTIHCDVKGCDNTEASEQTLPVVFITEQNEGRSSKPHVVLTNLDICPWCADYMVKHREMLTAAGAMGNNRYWFVSKETRDD